MSSQAFNYLLLSDTHLGSDLVPYLRPWALTSWLLEEADVDAKLISILEHYKHERDAERPWCLILAGDFLDLVGVALSPDADALHTLPSAEERRHGLGSAEDHVRCKLAAIAARHAGVFRALCRFVDAGHSLVVLRGNHDIELHWQTVQTALIAAISEHAEPARRAALARRIEVKPWFHCIDGLLYVEHGHEFDSMCSYGDPLDPTCLRDPSRIRHTPFSVLLRHVARPTRGVNSESHGYVGMQAYVVLLRKLGIMGSFQIAARFLRASRRLLAEGLAHTRQQAQQQAQRAASHLRRFASHVGIDEQHLQDVHALHVRPAVHSVNEIVRSLYLDRIASILLVVAVAGCGALALGNGAKWAALLCAVVAMGLAGFVCVGRGKNIAPTSRMRSSAERIAEVFGVRWVVMGHTHEPAYAPLSKRAHYVNLGSWGKDDPPDEQNVARQSPCTFLVIRHRDGDYHGEFLRWKQGRAEAAFAVQS